MPGLPLKFLGSAPMGGPGFLRSTGATLQFLSAAVMPSGQSIVIVAKDTDGNPANIASILSGNNRQSITLTALPSGNAFTLTFGGQTTAPIACSLALPLAYGLYTINGLVPGRLYDLAATWAAFGFESHGQLYEQFDTDGVTPLGSKSFNQSQNADSNAGGFTEGANPDSAPTRWAPLVPFTPSGTSITVRISAPSGDVMEVDGLRLFDTVTSTITYIDDATPGAFVMTSGDGDSQTGQSHWFDGTITEGMASGAGPRFVATGGASAIQSALLALSSVQAGGVIVTDSDGQGTSPYTVEFIGPMGGTSQGNITCTDPAVTMAVENPGGVYPSIQAERINGGDPILLKDADWGVGLPGDGGNPAPPAAGITVVDPNLPTVAAGGGGLPGEAGQPLQKPPYIPYIMFPLLQSAPDTQLALAFSGLTHTTAGGDFAAPGFATPTLAMSGSNTTTAVFPCQPAGTYKVSITYPASGGLSTAAGVTVTDNAGHTFATTTINQTITPTDFTADGASWTVLDGSLTITEPNTDIAVILSAGGQSVVFDAVRLDRTSDDLSINILSSDSVTFSAVDGWASTAAGPVAGATDLPLTNLVGGTYATPPTAPQTMTVGYNFTGSAFNGWMPVHANVAKGADFSQVNAADAHGYPTILSGPTMDVTICHAGTDNGGDGKGVAAFPWGDYTVLWDGAVSLELLAGDNLTGINFPPSGTTVTSGAATITGGSGNSAVFHIQPNGTNATYSPIFSLRIHGISSGEQFTCDLQNLRIFPPGVDVSAPPIYYQPFLDKMASASIVRLMDAFVTVGGSIVDITDFHDVDDISYRQPVRTINVAISSISAYTADAPWVDTGAVVPVLFSTAPNPHGFTTGQVVNLLTSATANLSNGSFSTTAGLGESFRWVQVINSTEFVVLLFLDRAHPSRAMTNTVTGSDCGSVQCVIGGGGVCWQDSVSLPNALNCDVHLSLCHSMSDACVSTLAAYHAENRTANKKTAIEWGNENWNSSEPVNSYCAAQTSLVLSGSNEDFATYSVYRSKQVHDLFATAYTNASRSSDFVRMIAGQAANPGVTGQLVQASVNLSAPIDEFPVAPYLNNQAIQIDQEPTLTPIYNRMTTGQLLDLFELVIAYGLTEIFISQHRSVLDAAGFSATKIVCYEWSPQQYVPGGTASNVGRRSMAAHRHPRAKALVLAALAKLAGAGCSRVTYYSLQIATLFNGVEIWEAYVGHGMQPGTGDPSVDTDNVDNPFRLDLIKSEVGAGIDAWAAMVSGVTPPPETPVLVPSRRLRIWRRMLASA